jgi:filamentous hemagglutinin
MEAQMRIIDDARAKHIFSSREGHIPDTTENRKLLEDVANDPKAKLATDKFGNTWHARVDAFGNQVWLQVRGDIIINGGINHPARPYNPLTGLSSPSKRGWTR